MMQWERGVPNAGGLKTMPWFCRQGSESTRSGRVRRRRVVRSLSEQCRIILRCADSIQGEAVAAELGVHEHTVGKWRRRFLENHTEGLLDEARPSRPRTTENHQVAAVVD